VHWTGGFWRWKSWKSYLLYGDYCTNMNEYTHYRTCISQSRVLGDIWWHGSFVTFMTSSVNDISLLSNKYSIFYNLLFYWIIQIYLIYKDECLFVCMYGTYTNSRSWSDLNQTWHTSPPWSGRDRGYVWTRNSLPLRPFGPFFFGGHCRIMGTRWLPARPFSAKPLYPWFQLVFSWRQRHYVVADGGVIRGSLISVILVGVPLTSRKWRRSRRQSHPPQRYIPHSSSCFCELKEITSLQTTVARSYSKCVALSAMRTILWDVNGIHVSTIRNFIRREGSD